MKRILTRDVKWGSGTYPKGKVINAHLGNCGVILLHLLISASEPVKKQGKVK